MGKGGITSTNWHSGMGAFGSTEKRFASMMNKGHSNPVTGGVSPGPGEYNIKGSMSQGTRFVTRKIRGRTVRIRSEMPFSCIFKSTTGRSLD